MAASKMDRIYVRDGEEWHWVVCKHGGMKDSFGRCCSCHDTGYRWARVTLQESDPEEYARLVHERYLAIMAEWAANDDTQNEEF